jgi:hypothetical protein
MPLGLNNFDRSNLFLGPIEGVGPENLGFLGPNGTRFGARIAESENRPLND